MILATYQPKEVNISKNREENTFKNLSNVLGYYPIFCFSAETVEDIYIGSTMSAPNCPERLIIFEVNSPDYIDIIKWNQLITTKEKIPGDLINSDCPIICREYVVPEITNIIANIDLEESLTIDLNFDEKVTDDYKEGATAMLKMMQEMAISENERAQYDVTAPLENLVFMRQRVLKMNYELFMLPITYGILFTGKLYITTNAKRYVYSEIRLRKMLVNFYNNEPEFIKYKTYSYFKEIYDLISFFLCDLSIESQEEVKKQKIYPNDPCFCGSNKKYKKCHGKK